MKLMRFGAVTTTMDVCRELATRGAADLTAVVADEQTAGRGRHGRVWHSPPGGAIYVSVLLRPALPAAQLNWLTMLGALAVCDASESAAGVAPRLKWFNDVEIDGRKLAGVLVEAAWLGERVEHAILGIGLNVSTDFSGAPDAVRGRATSLREAGSRTLERETVLARLLESIERRYRALCETGHSPLAEYVSKLSTLGRVVQLAAGDELIEGRAAAVDDDGALIVQTARGRRRVGFGELRTRDD